MAGGTSGCERVLERELSPGEVMYHLFHQEQPPVSTYLHVVTLHSASVITPQEVHTSLHHLATAQPMLTVSICEERGGGGQGRAHFRQVGHREVIVEERCIQTKEEWLTIGEQLLQRRFQDTARPMWQVTLVQVGEKGDGGKWCCVLLFLMQHVLVDGKSMVDVIHNQFLPVLSRVRGVRGHDVDVTDILKPLSLQPPCEVACSKLSELRPPVPWYTKAAINLLQLRGRLLHLDNKPPELNVCGGPLPLPSDGVGVGPRLVSHSLDMCVVERVRAQGRARGVTVTSCLTTAFTLALDKVSRQRGKPGAGTYHVSLPVDLRRFHHTLNTSPMPLGCYVGMFVPKLSVKETTDDPETFWSLCEIVQKQITKEMQKLKASSGKQWLQAMFCHILSKHTEENHIHKQLSLMGIRASYTLSNVGSCEQLASYDHTQVEVCEEYFMASPGISNTYVFMLTVLSVGGKMNFLAGFNPVWIEKQFMVDVFEAFDNIYSSIASH